MNDLSSDPFKNAFTYASIGMALVSLEGKWLNVNPALTQMFGFSEQEFLACDFQKLTHPDDLEADLKLVKAMLEREIETYQLEKRYFDRNGGIIWGLLSVSLVSDQSGNPLFFISQIQNITNLKKAEQTLIAKKRVEEQIKIYIQLAHEINNPLTIIDLSIFRGLDLLSEETIQISKVRDELNKIAFGTKRISTLVKNLDSIEQL